MSAPFNSLKGFLILDGGQLTGSFFHRTVVLICQHDANGAFGLVLNRPTGNKVGEMVLADLPEVVKEQPLFLGGPVQPSGLSYIYTGELIPDANILPNLNLGHSLEGLVDIGENISGAKQSRIFAGYSGWTAGQLEMELKRNSWLTFPADLDLVFSKPGDVWKNVLRRMSWKHRLIAEAPEDLSWN
jgi:putative transcriptional regulator